MKDLGSNLAVTGLGHCPLVLGECVQGILPDGGHFLITSPLGIFSWAEFTPGRDSDPLVVEPQVCAKALRAVARYLTANGLPAAGKLKVSRPIEPGMGFGTSTGDITAGIRAAAAACRRLVTPDEIARIAIEIEPTDGSMFSGCVAFGHRSGRLLEPLGELPGFEALVILTGGVVDTIEFDRVRESFRYSAVERGQLLAAWELVRAAIRQGDVPTLARATTQSARINQRFLPKPYFGELLDIVARDRADGLMAAHSGTALALVLDPARPDHAERMEAAAEHVEGLRPPSWFRISSRQRFLSPPSRGGGRDGLSAAGAVTAR